MKWKDGVEREQGICHKIIPIIFCGNYFTGLAEKQTKKKTNQDLVWFFSEYQEGLTLTKLYSQSSKATFGTSLV